MGNWENMELGEHENQQFFFHKPKKHREMFARVILLLATVERAMITRLKSQLSKIRHAIIARLN